MTTERKKEFARLQVEEKLSKADAYRKAYNRNDMSNSAASKAASRLSKDDEVLRYIDELNARLDTKAVMTRQERMEWLTQVVRTPLAQVNPESSLCQEYVKSTNGDGGSIRIKMPGKIDAIRELNRMDGACEPDKVEVTGCVDIGGVIDDILSE